MKVCHILCNYFPLYAGPYEYATNLDKQGVTVNVICMHREGELQRERVGGVDVYRIEPVSSRGPAAIENIIQFLVQATRILESSEHDICHVYLFRGAGLLPKLCCEKKVNWLLDIRSGSVSTSRWKMKLSNLASRLESTLYTYRVVVGNQLGRLLLGGSARYQILPLGVDTKKFVPGKTGVLGKAFGLPDSELVIVYVSRLSPSRRSQIVLEAFHNISASHDGVSLVVIGDGPDREKLVSFSKRRKIKRVFFTGFVNPSQVQEYVADADIGVSYIPINEQYQYQPPLKTVEYLSAGLITVATDTVGNRQFVHHLKNGLICGDSLENLVSALERVLSDKPLSERLRREARSSVLDRDWSNLVETILLPYYQEISDKRETPGKLT